MKERLALLATGATCALAGTVIAGGPATAQNARTAATDTQVRRAIERMNTNLSGDLDRIERAVREIRNGSTSGLSGASLYSIEKAIDDLCRATTTKSYGC